MTSVRSHRYGPVLLLVTLAAVAMVSQRPDEAAAAIRPEGSRAQPTGAIVYAAIGPELRVYRLDPASATLSERSSVTLPANIQAGCVLPSGRYVYVAWSDGTNAIPGSNHGVTAFRIDPTSEALSSDGAPVSLPSRPIYVSIDRSARHLLIAYTRPSGVTVHQIAPDGRVGPALSQAPLRLGVYAHEILVAPSNTMAVLVSRGNLPAAGRVEDPGALDLLGYENGVLRNRMTVAPDRGFGFHPRYIDFDPRRPWIYVSLSERNRIGLYRIPMGAASSAGLSFEKNTLADPLHVHPGQLTGALHVHPSGKFVYVANRVLNTASVDGEPVFAGGENDIAVFRINRETGEPHLIQNVDARGMVPGEFAFDPSGKLLVVANMRRLFIRADGALKPVPPSLAIFRIGGDGKLDFVRKYDVISGHNTLFWMAVSPLP